jgi:predicted ATP-dependent endonuclease of OLD family
MRISKLKIKNFQCFGPTGVEINFDEFTVLIGANSAGKTAVLLALQKLFGSNRERRLEKSDFYIPQGISYDQVDSISLSIEAIIHFPEFRDGEEDSGIPAIYNQLLISSDGLPYIRVRLEAKWIKTFQIEGEIESNFCYITSPLEDSSEDETKTFVKTSERGYINLFYIPAQRDPVSQLKNTTNTIIGRLLNYINWDEDFVEDIQEKTAALNNSISSDETLSYAQGIINSDWSMFNDLIEYNQAFLHSNQNDFNNFIKRLSIRFQSNACNEVRNIDESSEGQKSLFYISLVCSLLRIEKKILVEENPYFTNSKIQPPLLTILALEEPENHLAPHILGKILANLTKMASENIFQVILTSHSPSIIKRIDPDSIRFIRYDFQNKESTIQKLLLPQPAEEAFKYIKEAIRNYPELYYSKGVILVEGDSESIGIPRIIEVKRESTDFAMISVVPIGGKFVNHFWRLLDQLNIPYVTLLDYDIFKHIVDPVVYVCKEYISLSKPLELDDERVDLENVEAFSEYSYSDLKRIISQLEAFDIFFSFPLDFDYLMLSQFEERYQNLKEGRPRVLAHREEDDFNEKLMEYIQKIFDNDIDDIDDDELNFDKELLAWHRYLFSKNKPFIHHLFFRTLTREDLSQIPPVINRLIDRITSKINEVSRADDSP